MPGRTPAEHSWLRVHAYLNRHRHQLSLRAAAGYPAADRLAP